MRRAWPGLIATWIALAAVALALRGWNASLESRGAAERAEGGAVVPLIAPALTRVVDEDSGLRTFVDPASGEPRQVAALTVERSDGRGGRETFFFARTGGLWRCTTHFGLVASDARLGALTRGILDARVQVRAADGELAGYGLGDDAVRVSLHGRDVLKADDRDVLFSVDVGRPLARGGAFARRSGEAEVLELDRDLADGLRFRGRPVTGLATPPLVDPHVIPSAWPGFQVGIRRVFVDRADGSGFELRREATAAGPDGAAGLKWVVVDAESGAPADAHPLLAMGYELFLSRAPFDAPVDPRTVSASDLERPEAVLTIEPAAGELLEVLVLRPGPTGERVVIDRFSQTAVQVSRAVGDLLIPDSEQLVDPSLGNPWDPWLR